MQRDLLCVSAVSSAKLVGITQLCKLLRVRGALDARVVQYCCTYRSTRHAASYILVPVLAGDAAEYLILGSGSKLTLVQGVFAQRERRGSRTMSHPHRG